MPAHGGPIGSSLRTALLPALVSLLALSACTGGFTATPAPSASADAATAAVEAAVSPGDHRTTSSDYRLPDLRLPGVRLPVEVQGHVVGPIDVEGSLPLVVLLHGYTASCWRPADGSSTTDWPCRGGFRPIPSWRGFDYLQERLASQGYLTVSLHANGVNVLATQMGDDAGAAARAALVARHLDAWAAGQVPGLNKWPSVDLDHVLLVGHSRGGEGVDRAVAERPADAAWTVAGEVLVAPTDFEPPERTSVPLVAMTGYCDGDVGPGPGQRYVDRLADLDLLRTSIVVAGANHNFFNAEWVPADATVPGGFDDALGESGEPDPMCAPGADTRLTAAEQQDVAQRVLGLAAAAFLRGDTAAADVLDGRVPLPVAGDTVVHVSAVGRGRTTLTHGSGYTADGQGAMKAFPCDGVSETEEADDCGRFTGEGQSVHWPGAYRGWPVEQYVELAWRGDGVVVLTPTEPFDLSESTGVAARVALTPEGPPTAFAVTLTDAAGHDVTWTSNRIVPFPDGPRLPSRRYGFQVLAPRSDPGDVDLSAVTQVMLTPTAPRGHGWIIDVSAPPAH